MALKVGDVFVVMHGMVPDGMIVQLRRRVYNILGSMRKPSMGYTILLRIERPRLPREISAMTVAARFVILARLHIPEHERVSFIRCQAFLPSAVKC